MRDWSSRQSIRNSWRKYHEEYTSNWHYNDDKDTGEFTIEEYDPDTGETAGLLYSFELKNGMWNMLDKNGNIVDTFEPHGGDGSARALQQDDQDDIDEFLKGMAFDSSSDTVRSDDDNEKKYAANENGEPVKASGENSSDASNEQGDLVGAKEETPSSQTAAQDNSEARADASKAATDEEDEDNSNTAVLLVSAAAVTAAAVGIILYKKKGK